MENKINIVELLKDCPTGMELDCTMYNKVTLLKVDTDDTLIFPITIVRKDGNIIKLTKYGQYANVDFAKCIIFPKGKTTWEGFQIPFKDGDVVAAGYSESTQLFLLKHLTHCKDGNTNTGYCYFGWDFYYNRLFEEGNWGFCRLATEEEKEKLFDTIKANGYKWNDATKTLEKLTPKFKVGNKIKLKGGDEFGIITQVADSFYTIKCKNNTHYWSIKKQDDWELVPNKFDINSLIPFESRVLIRDSKSQKWSPAIWGFYDSDSQDYRYKLVGIIARYCIPYEGNEHLLGTTDDCDEYFNLIS